jgi:hypothetical protein
VADADAPVIDNGEDDNKEGFVTSSLLSLLFFWSSKEELVAWLFDLCGILKLLDLKPVLKPRAKLARLVELGNGGVFGLRLVADATVDDKGADVGFEL